MKTLVALAFLSSTPFACDDSNATARDQKESVAPRSGASESEATMDLPGEETKRELKQTASEFKKQVNETNERIDDEVRQDETPPHLEGASQ